MLHSLNLANLKRYLTEHMFRGGKEGKNKSTLSVPQTTFPPPILLLVHQRELHLHFKVTDLHWELVRISPLQSSIWPSHPLLPEAPEHLGSYCKQMCPDCLLSCREAATLPGQSSDWHNWFSLQSSGSIPHKLAENKEK